MNFSGKVVKFHELIYTQMWIKMGYSVCPLTRKKLPDSPKTEAIILAKVSPQLP